MVRPERGEGGLPSVALAKPRSVTLQGEGGTVLAGRVARPGGRATHERQELMWSSY